MANRRMLSLNVIDSDMFLDLPISSQNLYFHLCMRADDDGFIKNPRRIQRMIGAADDDLRLLIAKQFIIPFDSGIVVIKHWRIHNYIQKDRYHGTMCLDEKSQISVGKDGSYELLPDNAEPLKIQDSLTKDTDCAQDVSNMDTECVQDASNMDTEVRLELGKDRLELNNTDSKESVSPNPAGSYTEIQHLYNEICKSFPKCVKLSERRRRAIGARMRAGYTLEDFERLFKKAEQSEFLKGGNDRDWRADFDWMLKDSNIVKVLEGKYDDRNRSNGRPENMSKQADGEGEEDPPWIIQG